MISIIVPVYKAENFIRKCVESILMQQSGDWELLLIDDGSPDDSGIICDEYANKDKRIKVFHKLNGGVSSARNLGIEEANGDWIMFVDADDSICPDTISECSKFFEYYDIIRFEAIDSYGNIMSLPKADSTIYLEQILERKSFLAIWGGLYKKKLFENNKIRFDSNLRYGEDWAVLIDLLTNSDKIKLFHKQFYLYNNQNESSFLNTMTFDKLSNLMFAFSTIANMKNIRKYSDILRNTRLNLIYTTISTCIYIDQSVSEINTHIDKIFEISNKPSLYDIFNSDIVFKRKILLVSYMSTIVRTILFKIIQFNKK